MKARVRRIISLVLTFVILCGTIGVYGPTDTNVVHAAETTADPEGDKTETEGDKTETEGDKTEIEGNTGNAGNAAGNETVTKEKAAVQPAAVLLADDAVEYRDDFPNASVTLTGSETVYNTYKFTNKIDQGVDQGVWFKAWQKGYTGDNNDAVMDGKLEGYDAYTYYLDTTYRDGESKPTEYKIEVHLYAKNNKNNMTDYQAKKYYYVSDDGAVFSSPWSNVPANFKGNVYVLFEDAKNGTDSFQAHVKTAAYRTNRLVKTGVNEATVKMSTPKMVKNGKDTIKNAEKKAISLKNASQQPVNITYNDDNKYTVKGNNIWWKAWVSEPFTLSKNIDSEGNIFSIDLNGYDAFAYHIDTTNTTLGYDKSGDTYKQKEGLQIETVFYASKEARTSTETKKRCEARPAKLYLITDDGEYIPTESRTTIPLGFKGTVYILFEEVTRDANPEDFVFNKNLANAYMYVTRVVSTGEFGDANGGKATGATFEMRDMEILADGALTVRKAEAEHALNTYCKDNEDLIKAAGAENAVDTLMTSICKGIEEAKDAKAVVDARNMAMEELNRIVNQAGGFNYFQKTFKMEKGAAIRMVEIAGKYALVYQCFYDQKAYDIVVEKLGREYVENNFKFSMVITMDGQTQKIPVDADDIKVEDGRATFQVIFEVPKENVGKTITGQGILECGVGLTLKATPNLNSYSVKKIAQIALTKTGRYSDEQRKELQKIVNLK